MAFAKVPDSITTKDEYDTVLGKLKFYDGLPDDATVQKVYDNLDRSRAMHAFMDMIPLASMEAMRSGFAAVGCDACHKACLYGSLMDSKSLWLTGNTDTVYVGAILNLQKDGPVIIDVPPGAGPGLVNDAFFRYVGDMGKPGPDKGSGGKYLVLPPGYDQEVPFGFYVMRSPSYTNWVLLRGFLKEGRPDAAAKLWRDGLKIYPFSTKSCPPKMEFIDMSGKEMNTIHSNDFGFFKEVNDVIQREPIDFLDPELRGNLSAIGIRTLEVSRGVGIQTSFHRWFVVSKFKLPSHPGFYEASKNMSIDKINLYHLNDLHISLYVIDVCMSILVRDYVYIYIYINIDLHTKR